MVMSQWLGFWKSLCVCVLDGIESRTWMPRCRVKLCGNARMWQCANEHGNWRDWSISPKPKPIYWNILHSYLFYSKPIYMCQFWSSTITRKKTKLECTQHLVWTIFYFVEKRHCFQPMHVHQTSSLINLSTNADYKNKLWKNADFK